MRNNNDVSFPCLELPLRCYISNQVHDKCISCNAEGDIMSTNNRQASEEWFIVEDGSDGTYRLMNCAHPKFLHLNPNDDYQIQTSDRDPSKWNIRKAEGCTFTICESNTERYLLMNNDGHVWSSSATTTGDEDAMQKWHIEFLSGELCSISSLSNSKLISCHAWGGKLSMAEARERGSEIWRFLEVGDGTVRISNWTHKNKILCSNADGKVWTTGNLQGDWEKWEIQRAPQEYDGVIIRSVCHGKYLSICCDGRIGTKDVFAGRLSTWLLGSGHGNQFFLSSSAFDKRLGSTKDGDIFSTDNRKAWEVWKIIQLDDGCIALFSKEHGKYLVSNPEGRIYTTGHLYEWGKWEIEWTPSGGILLRSKEHERYLSHPKGHVCTTTTCNTMSHLDHQVWKLEPQMPETMTGDEMRNKLIAGSLLGAVAAPFVITGAIGAIGFTSSGIAAGTIAPWMMSMEAILSGGGVAAGGIVATLQSIGAVGLGLTGISASAGAGALAGAFTVGMTAADREMENVEASSANGSRKMVPNRPFCEWREWNCDIPRTSSLGPSQLFN